MLASAITLKRGHLLAHLEAITCCFGCWRRIRARRRTISGFRRQSDAAIFAKVLRTPKLNYFVKTFRGRIGEFVDEESPGSEGG